MARQLDQQTWSSDKNVPLRALCGVQKVAFKEYPLTYLCFELLGRWRHERGISSGGQQRRQIARQRSSARCGLRVLSYIRNRYVATEKKKPFIYQYNLGLSYPF